MRHYARTTLVLAAAAAVAALLLSATASADNPVLTGTVGPGFSIGLVDSSGARVQRLDAGTYTIVVHDLAEEHNFHLSGPGVNQFTEVETKGDATWTVTFKDGSYTYVCDPHASIMSGGFTVGAVGAPQPPAATVAAPAARPRAPVPATAAKKAAAAKAAAAKAAAAKAKAAKAKAAKAKAKAK